MWVVCVAALHREVTASCLPHVDQSSDKVGRWVEERDCLLPGVSFVLWSHKLD